MANLPTSATCFLTVFQEKIKKLCQKLKEFCQKISDLGKKLKDLNENSRIWGPVGPTGPPKSVQKTSLPYVLLLCSYVVRMHVRTTCREELRSTYIGSCYLLDSMACSRPVRESQMSLKILIPQLKSFKLHNLVFRDFLSLSHASKFS